MPYTHTLWNSCDEIVTSVWESVCSQDRNPFMKIGFLKAVEEAVTDPGEYWYAVVYDDSGTPVACACFSSFIVDGALMASSRVQRLVAGIRRVFPRFFRFKLLLCGFPVSTSAGQIAATPDVDWNQLSDELNSIAQQLARSAKASLISFKEFDEELTARLSRLQKRGYRRMDSLVAYVLDTPYASFDEYYERRSKRTRANMRKVFRKAEDAKLECVCVKGGEETAERCGDQVYALYDAVFQQAETKFERLPSDFFGAFARNLPEDARFTFLYEGEKLVSFCCAIAGEQRYHMVYCGIDYERNEALAAYFNMIYRALEFGLTEPIDEAHIGATADEFKRRMGCRAVQLSAYVNAPGRVRSLIFNLVARPFLG
jgi:predicted N-acyltransferase